MTRWACVETVTELAGVLEVGVHLYSRAGPAPALRLLRRTDGFGLTYHLAEPAHEHDGRRVARVPIRDVFGVPPSLELSARGGGDELWDAWVQCADSALPLALREPDSG